MQEIEIKRKFFQILRFSDFNQNADSKLFGLFCHLAHSLGRKNSGNQKHRVGAGPVRKFNFVSRQQKILTQKSRNFNALSFQLIKAETTGPEKGKFTPKITNTAKALWTIYILFTCLELVLLKIAGRTQTLSRIPDWCIRACVRSLVLPRNKPFL